jgi:hypothetical protein
MSPPNGREHEDRAPTPYPPVPMLEAPVRVRVPTERIKELIAALEVPFDPSQIEWRVMNTTKNRPARGQVVPYADQRAYTDRLNALFTPAGWTRKYTIHTSANFERSKDQKIVAKVLVNCELTIFGLGSHSATGEEWADDDNAVTSAEAQSFKRASACFGLGRYFYYFVGAWVDLDERKRPKTIPQLAGWATPAGWLEGLRPSHSGRPNPLIQNSHAHGNGNRASADAEMLRQIEGMEEILGKRMYRGLLKTIARVWNPKDIRDYAIQQRVLAHMQAAGRGLRRLEVALDRVGPEALDKLLRARSLRSLDQVDNLSALHEIVCALESATS